MPKRDTNAINNGIGWIPGSDHNNNGFNAMLETNRAAIREDLIGRIVRAAARPCPEITEARRARHKETGTTCSLFGMPFGFQTDDYETITIGYVYRDGKSNTTYGTVYLSRELAEAAHESRSEANAADFRRKLEAMSASELNDQAAYWIK